MLARASGLRLQCTDSPVTARSASDQQDVLHAWRSRGSSRARAVGMILSDGGNVALTFAGDRTTTAK